MQKGPLLFNPEKTNNCIWKWKPQAEILGKLGSQETIWYLGVHILLATMVQILCCLLTPFSRAFLYWYLSYYFLKVSMHFVKLSRNHSNIPVTFFFPCLLLFKGGFTACCMEYLTQLVNSEFPFCLASPAVQFGFCFDSWWPLTPLHKMFRLKKAEKSFQMGWFQPLSSKSRLSRSSANPCIEMAFSLRRLFWWNKSDQRLV